METDHPPQPILPPNIDDPKDLGKWINRHITQPSDSFKDPDLTHPDGTPLTDGERLDKTREQIRLGVDGLNQLKKPKSAIEGYLLSYLPPTPPVNKPTSKNKP